MTVAEIAYNMHTSLFHACALLFDLVEKDAIRVGGEASAPEVPADLSGLNLPQSVDDLLQLAREEMKDNSVDNALAIIHSALDREPNSAEAQCLREQAENRYVRQAFQNGLSRKSVPRLLASLEQLEHERLGPQEGFIISRINGEWDIASILSVCPFREADCVRMIKKLIENGIVGVS
jgi:hypothetical protein